MTTKFILLLKCSAIGIEYFAAAASVYQYRRRRRHLHDYFEYRRLLQGIISCPKQSFPR